MSWLVAPTLSLAQAATDYVQHYGETTHAPAKSIQTFRTSPKAARGNSNIPFPDQRTQHAPSHAGTPARLVPNHKRIATRAILLATLAASWGCAWLKISRSPAGSNMVSATQNNSQTLAGKNTPDLVGIVIGNQNWRRNSDDEQDPMQVILRSGETVAATKRTRRPMQNLLCGM